VPASHKRTFLIAHLLFGWTTCLRKKELWRPNAYYLCERNGLIVINSWFRKPKRRLYTWKAPGNWSQHQLDYILVKHQFRNCVKDVQTLPGADIDPDHNILVAKICARLKKIIR
jgi:hypothetical protein